jgi:hypothetical protein
MMQLFGEREVQDVEVIAIQEPMINRSTTQMTTHVQTLQGKFHVAIRPTSSHAEADKPRVCFFINKKLHPKQWTVQHHSRFLSTLTLRGTGLREPVHIHNIYNPGPPAPSVLGELARAIEGLSGAHLVVGDFNLHHPLWAVEDYEHQHEEANELVDLAADHQLELLLPSNTVTYEKNRHQTTIDLVWGTPQLADRLVKCQARQDW